MTTQILAGSPVRTGTCPEPDCGHRSLYPLAPGVEARLICGWCGAIYLSGDGQDRGPRTLHLGYGTRPGKAAQR
jgi:hypothetical protein